MPHAWSRRPKRAPWCFGVERRDPRDLSGIAADRDPAQIARIKALAPALKWRPLGKPAPQVWRDDYASILPYVTWTNFLGIN